MYIQIFKRTKISKPDQDSWEKPEYLELQKQIAKMKIFTKATLTQKLNFVLEEKKVQKNIENCVKWQNHACFFKIL